jgi:hypothetical protein
MRDDELTTAEAEVSVRAITDVLGQPPHIRLVKIDVEGSEARILNSLIPWISRGIIDFIDVELNDEYLGPEWDNMDKVLRELEARHGASFATLDGEGELQPLDLRKLLHGPNRQHVIVRFLHE